MYNIYIYIMKLTKLHLFLILLATLLAGAAGLVITEGLTDKTGRSFNNDAEELADDTEVDKLFNPYQASQDTSKEGLTRNQIPQGDENLYMLKSEIVPPVCPACPTVTSCPRQEPCRPCPPCGRCPAPAFDCKKVPNYKTNDDNYLPRPVLADFSQFGM
jgi:hypothetical protein